VSAQQFIARTMMRLPAGLLRSMSKGAVLNVDGREIDPGVGFLTAQAGKGPGVHTLPIAEGRAATRAGFAMMNAPRSKNVGVTDLSIPGPGGSLRARHYWPINGKTNDALMVYFHMGGCVIGDLDTCDHFCSLIAAETGAGVISVDYRMAPEHVFPAAAEDAIAAFKWVRDNAAQFAGAADRVAVGGDSAGGHLATIVAQEMKRRGETGPCLQVLIYPWVDMTDDAGSMRSCGDCIPLNTATMRWFESLYMPEGADKTAAMASPGLVEDLSGLPKALVYTAGFDPLRDQGEAYARRLEDAGVQVTFREYGDLPHGFTAMSGVSKRAKDVNLEIVSDIAAAL
jgi:acetyl esterase